MGLLYQTPHGVAHTFILRSSFIHHSPTHPPTPASNGPTNDLGNTCHTANLKGNRLISIGNAAEDWPYGALPTTAMHMALITSGP